jgi:hypothetical protein
MTIGADQRAVQVWDDDGGRTPSEKAVNDSRDWIKGVIEMASRPTRRYPLQIFAGALVLGFMIGRVRR